MQPIELKARIVMQGHARKSGRWVAVARLELGRGIDRDFERSVEGNASQALEAETVARRQALLDASRYIARQLGPEYVLPNELPGPSAVTGSGDAVAM